MWRSGMNKARTRAKQCTATPVRPEARSAGPAARRQHCCTTRGRGRLPTCTMKRATWNLSCTMAYTACQACSNGQKSNPTLTRKRSYKSQIKSAKEQRRHKYTIRNTLYFFVI
ncbi:hypothetical protein HAX54_017780, partial [Datura stramonium]|nr:hypothetical protein [Datura stramonium]